MSNSDVAANTALLGAARRWLRAALRGLGYDIVRANVDTPDRPAWIDQWREKPYGRSLVEFVGASGVGKTTLFDMMLDTRGPEDGWLTPREFLSTCGSNSDSVEFDELYEQLLLLKHQDVCEHDLLPSRLYQLLEFFYGNLRLDRQVNASIPVAPVVFDDGLVHNFSSCLLRLWDTDPNGVARLVSNRAFIHCYVSPDVLTQRILKRNSTGSARPQHIGLSEFELLEQSRATLRQKADLVARLNEEEGCPYLEVDLAVDADSNVEAIRSFLKNL